MEYDISIDKEPNDDYYIIIYYNNDMYVSDDEVAELLGVSKKFYFNIAKSFKGELICESLYFKKENHIIKFKDFIETLLVAKTLDNS